MSEISKNSEVFKTLRFSSEQTEELKKRGFIIFELTGQSITSIKASRNFFSSYWHNGKDIEHVTSKNSEVAINPERLYLPYSGNLTLPDQLLLTDRYSKNVSQEIPGVVAVIGSMADYLELECLYRDNTLYAARDDRISTTTLTEAGRNVFVGESFDGGLVASYRFGLAYTDIKVVPLIVPEV